MIPPGFISRTGQDGFTKTWPMDYHEGMKKYEKIGFIGAGNMAFALAGGIARAFPSIPMTGFDISHDRLQLFEEKMPLFERSTANADMADACDLIFLAIKPQILPQVLPEMESYTGTILSIAAGIPLKTLTQGLPRAKVVRVMPNTPCLVGQMAAGCTFSSIFPEEEKAAVLEILSTSGVVEEVPEEMMDTVTALSGSGPAFWARLFESFIEAAEDSGLPANTARRLCLQTARGTATLLEEKGMTPEELINQVSSPGGTTLAGRSVLESSPMKDIIKKTLKAAEKRSKELGE